MISIRNCWRGGSTYLSNVLSTKRKSDKSKTENVPKKIQVHVEAGVAGSVGVMLDSMAPTPVRWAAR